MVLLRLFFKGYVIVLLTAINVGQVAAGHAVATLFTGGLLSWVWWDNTHSAAHSHVRGARLAYALGAAAGNVTGVLLVGWFHANRS